MTKARATVLLFLLCAAWPSGAYAQGEIIDWFDHLSGPGPFHNKGVGAEFNLWCFPPSGRYNLNCWGSDGLDPLSDMDSPNDSKLLVKYSLSRSTTGSRQLFQDDPLDVRDVHQFTNAFSVMYRANRIVEVGAGVNFVRFSSDEGNAFSFWRTGWVPARMNVTPLGLLKATGRGRFTRRLIQFEADAIYYSEGFVGADFNNPRTRFTVGAEYQTRLAIVIDGVAAWRTITGK